MRRFVPAYARAVEGDAPIASLNITPLIDVMLVLLVMFILAVPAMTHEVPLDLPQPAPVAAPQQIHHLLTLDRAGQARLDGMALSDPALSVRLASLRTDPRAELAMRTDPETRYVRFDEVLAVVKRAGITRLGFEGNEGMDR
jgi:biopolymer transport protein ExbD